MSSKSRRAGTATPQPGSTSTPLPPTVSQSSSSSSQSQQASSPLSPTRYSRINEKRELQNLNDRLATYIDRVRNLEVENARLTSEVQVSRDSITRETTSIKNIYEGELVDARKMLDQFSRERALQEMDLKRLLEREEELKSKLEKKTKECNQAEEMARIYELRANEFNNKYNQANADRKKANDELNDALKEINRLSKLHEEARKCLEVETIARVDVENALLSLREELALKDQVHTQEINESRRTRHLEYSETDGRSPTEYEIKLKESLLTLRDQYEEQLRLNREDIESMYKAKIRSLQDAASRNHNTSHKSIEELRSARTRIDNLHAQISGLQANNQELGNRVRELEQQLDKERELHSNEVASLEKALQDLREQMTRQLQEYQDLMDIKVTLDVELAAYDKLLNHEETRLNITPAPTSESFSQSLRSTRATPSRRTPSGGLKRKRAVVEESEDRSVNDYYLSASAKGNVEIKEIDPEGKYVKLFNKGSDEIAIGGWQLQRSINEAGPSATYKFHRSVKIEPGATVTVWSGDTRTTHDPPANIVMKQKWTIGDNSKTVLINSEGETVANLDRIKRIVSTHMSRTGFSRRRSISALDGNEQLYHQTGDPQQSGEKCAIM